MIKVDKITLGVIQAGLQQVCDEMDLSFSRSAFTNGHTGIPPKLSFGISRYSVIQDFTSVKICFLSITFKRKGGK